MSAQAPVAARPAVTHDERAHARRESLLAVGMLAPAVIFILLLVGVPFGLAIYYSLHDVTTGGTAVKWVGLRHFSELLRDRVFLRSLANTLLFTVSTLVAVLVLGTILAELLMREFRGKWVVRFLILLPWTAPVALGLIGWLWMFDSVFSPIDWLLRQVGLLGHRGAALGALPNLYWLGDPVLAKVSIVLVNVWRILPLATVIVLAGLNSIPRDVIEQTRVDRAGYFRRLFDITLPMLSPILLVAVLFTFVFTFSDMIAIFILTRGGPANMTQTLASHAFFTGILGGNLGRGAAIALFLLPVLAGVSAVLLRLIRRSEVI
ncbi:MAG TPA: sugar ABC transporter permease [Trueperaceae bacterium]|jgi:multiple sugar transport system permease protein